MGSGIRNTHFFFSWAKYPTLLILDKYTSNRTKMKQQRAEIKQQVASKSAVVIYMSISCISSFPHTSGEETSFMFVLENRQGQIILHTISACKYSLTRIRNLLQVPPWGKQHLPFASLNGAPWVTLVAAFGPPSYQSNFVGTHELAEATTEMLSM